MRGSHFTLVALGVGAALTPAILDVDVTDDAVGQNVLDLLAPDGDANRARVRAGSVRAAPRVFHRQWDVTMLLTHYYAVVVGATLLTAAWLFKPEARTAVTTLGAFLAWALAALLGDNTEAFATRRATVETVNNTTVAVPQGEALTAAPVPGEFRLFATLWALLSALALLLYVWGVYPPADERPVDKSDMNEP